MSAFELINEVVWGIPMLALLFFAGIFFSVKLRAFQVTGIKKWLRETAGSLGKKRGQGKGISPFRAVASSLASSVGTGNIIGVATAISAGGAGAAFWMWVSAILGAATKYAEIYLAVKFRKTRGGAYYGGPMYYIEQGLGKKFFPLAAAFSFAAAVSCLGMGGANQANAISSVLGGINIPKGVSAALLAAVCIAGLRGGIARISSAAEKLVPFMAAVYVLGGAAVIIINPQRAGAALCEIVNSAINPRAVYGASAGLMLAKSLRFGVARGVFSNEAGLGSAPMVHAAADCESPEKEACWGIFEVFLDTLVICTVTAITVVGAGRFRDGLYGAELVAASFEQYFGGFGKVFVGFATVLFSLTTVLGWSYYGEVCVVYLSGEREIAKKAYRALFCAAVVFGALYDAKTVWEIADTANGFMMLPNIAAILMLSKHIKSPSI